MDNPPIGCPYPRSHPRPRHMRPYTPLPEWAEIPLTMDQAAVALGVSKRALTDMLRDYPYFESRGRKKVFYSEHIQQLRAATWDSDSAKQETGISTHLAPSPSPIVQTLSFETRPDYHPRAPWRCRTPSPS